jgi:hypothetical protein
MLHNRRLTSFDHVHLRSVHIDAENLVAFPSEAGR